jgi:ribosomal protein S15P/S13E
MLSEKDLNPLTINDLLAKADQAKDKFMSSQIEFYRILAYLDRTKRYKEDEQYKTASFAVFISTRYGISYNAYTKNRIALFEYGDEVKEHGLGFVSQAVKELGPIKAKKAFTECKKVQATRKKPLRTSDKSEIIKKFTVPKTAETTKREQPRHDWEYAFKQEHRRAEGLQASLAEKTDQAAMLIKKNKELTQDLAKVHKTLENERNMREEAETMILMLQEELDRKDKVINALRIAGYGPVVNRHEPSEGRPARA